MNISAPFIRRPVATSLLAAAILLAGLLAYTRLPVAPLPRVDFPTIQVSAPLPGASPETMASSVATPLERRFGRIAGLAEMTSTSTLGSTSITLQFDLNRNVDAAARDVQAAIAAAGGELPPDLPLKPTYRKVNPADAPSSSSRSPATPSRSTQVFDAANTILAQKISQVHGVGQVFVAGGQQPAVRVQVDPAGARRDGPRHRRTCEQAERRRPSTRRRGRSPAGRRRRRSAPTTRSSTPAATRRSSSRRTGSDGAARRRRARLRRRREQPRRRVGRRQARRAHDRPQAAGRQHHRDEPADPRRSCPSSRRRSRRRSRSRSAATGRRRSAPRSRTSRGRWSSASCSSSWSSSSSSARAAATLVPAVAMPLSLVGTFGVMWLLGYSIDNLSLMALTISTGFVVDDAIVVTENITRAIEHGDSAVRGGAQGRQADRLHDRLDHGVAARVFVPILLMGGIVGRLFREFAVTLSVAIAVSALVSLTLTPMMCSRMLRSEKGVKHGRLYRAFGAPVRRDARVLRARPRWALRHRVTMLLVTVLTVAVNVALFAYVPKGLFPQQDTGLLMASTEAAQDVSFAKMFELQTQVNKILSDDPDIEHYVSFIGSGGQGTGNTGAAFITLKPLPPRKRSADQVLARLRGKLAKIEGINTYLQSRQDVSVGGRQSRTQYQYTVEDANLDELLGLGASRARRAEEAAPAEGRQHRPAERRPRARRRHRSRHGLAPRGHRAGDRRRALRRVRPAVRRDDVHAAERVPRGPRGGGAPARQARTRSTASTSRARRVRPCRCGRSRKPSRRPPRSRSTTTASSPR